VQFTVFNLILGKKKLHFGEAVCRYRSLWCRSERFLIRKCTRRKCLPQCHIITLYL